MEGFRIETYSIREYAYYPQMQTSPSRHKDNLTVQHGALHYRKNIRVIPSIHGCRTINVLYRVRISITPSDGILIREGISRL